MGFPGVRRSLDRRDVAGRSRLPDGDARQVLQRVRGAVRAPGLGPVVRDLRQRRLLRLPGHGRRGREDVRFRSGRLWDHGARHRGRAVHRVDARRHAAVPVLRPHAPHEPAMAAPGDRRAYTDLGAWRPPNYDEADVSDKPAYIRDQPRMDAVASARIDEFRRSQYASLLAVDRAVGTIVDALEQTERLSNTLIVYTSDNGMSWGEHRWGRSSCPTRRASTCRSSCASTR